MELPFGEMEPLIEEIERVAYEIIGRDKFLVTLGGEHSITPPLGLGRGAQVSRDRLGAPDRRSRRHARRLHGHASHNHACAMRRAAEFARITQVGIRSLSTEEAEVAAQAEYVDLLRRAHASTTRPGSTGRRNADEHVYVSIDVDGLDPAIMPATGTPEPGGLTWSEITRLLRATAERRRIVAADVVELSPIAGMVAPNFLCAKLIYKLLTYRFVGRSPGAAAVARRNAADGVPPR